MYQYTRQGSLLYILYCVYILYTVLCCTVYTVYTVPYIPVLYFAGIYILILSLPYSLSHYILAPLLDRRPTPPPTGAHPTSAAPSCFFSHLFARPPPPHTPPPMPRLYRTAAAVAAAAAVLAPSSSSFSVLWAADATAATKDTGAAASPTASERLSSLLDGLDARRRTILYRYSAWLHDMGRRTRETLYDADVPSDASSTDWLRISKDAGSSVLSRGAAPGWWLRHLFSTTTVSVSCTKGGGAGDPDFDEIDGCSLSTLQELRFDVHRDDNGICQSWDRVDLTPWALMVAEWKEKLNTKSRNNNVGGGVGNDDEVAHFEVHPGRFVEGALRQVLPDRVAEWGGTLFGFCEPCHDHCGGPVPAVCANPPDTSASGIFTSWFAGTGSDVDADAADADQRPPGCPENAAVARALRSMAGDYACGTDTAGHQSCRIKLSPYHDPHIRVVDVRGPGESSGGVKYHLSVHRQVDTESIQSAMAGIALCTYASTLAASRALHLALGYAAGSTVAVGVAVHRLIRSGTKNALPSWARTSSSMAVMAFPSVSGEPCLFWDSVWLYWQLTSSTLVHSLLFCFRRWRLPSRARFGARSYAPRSSRSWTRTSAPQLSASSSATSTSRKRAWSLGQSKYL